MLTPGYKKLSVAFLLPHKAFLEELEENQENPMDEDNNNPGGLGIN
jgi:hypothetical protein